MREDHHVAQGSSGRGLGFGEAAGPDMIIPFKTGHGRLIGGRPDDIQSRTGTLRNRAREAAQLEPDTLG